MSKPNNEFRPEIDEKLREVGAVYTQDLALSRVLVALRTNARSPLFAALNLNSQVDVLPKFDAHTEFHEDLIRRVSLAARRVLTPKGTEIESDDFPEVHVSKNVFRCVEVVVDYWGVAPLKVGFMAARESVDRATLKGFLGFDPRGYDEDARKGKAQDVIDKLRSSLL